jgi:formylglycine-generating enzyme required for sulfatase activity
MSSPRKISIVAGIVVAMAPWLGACSGDDSAVNNNNNQNNSSDLCPSGYLHVPGGTFTMGVDEEDIADLIDGGWTPAYGPAHLVTLSPYCMSKTEVTVAEYRSCRDSGNCAGDGPWPIEQDPGCNYSDTDDSRLSHPANCVNFDQAQQYCQAQGGDLPTEAQWVRAAQGDDRRHYPWGNAIPTCSLANWDVNGSGGEVPNGDGCAETVIPPFTWQVGSAPAGASPYGLLDMAGNVSEFVRNCIAPFSACDGELGCVDPQPTSCTDDNTPRLVLGGNFFIVRSGLYSFTRGLDESNYARWVGFRCVALPLGK